VATFYVENFGCRATQADGAAIERQFRDCGLARAGTAIEAEVVVLNTCTVTAAADQDARAAIRRIHQKNPNAQIVVTGCYAQRAPEEIAALPGVTKVIGNSNKHELAKLALMRLTHASSMQGNSTQIESVEIESLPDGLSFRAQREICFSQDTESSSKLIPLTTLSDNWQPGADNRIFVSDIFAHSELLAAPVFEAANERTRPNLKIQDGCGNRCSFCVIPSVRGNSRSLQKDRILREINALVSAGYREVVISGINLGRWGRDLEAGSQRLTAYDQGLAGLIRCILDETDLEKLRVSSVEPMDWSDDLIHLMASSPRIAKHAHVPMQSGSDTVLRRMHRKYRPWHYREKIEKIHAAMPNAAIGADAMVGFPGETDAEFAETQRMVEDLPFTYLHIFTYSARPGTPAAAMPNQVSVRIAKERNQILRDLAAQKKLAFMQGFVGKTIEAITLKTHDAFATESLTENYLKLRLEGVHEPNRWITARINRVEEGMLAGSTNEFSANHLAT
jgi:threonylcarbamoyladenosine tRNA methylthiotransferase MtaB